MYLFKVKNSERFFRGLGPFYYTRQQNTCTACKSLSTPRRHELPAFMDSTWPSTPQTRWKRPHQACFELLHPRFSSTFLPHELSLCRLNACGYHYTLGNWLGSPRSYQWRKLRLSVSLFRPAKRNRINTASAQPISISSLAALGTQCSSTPSSLSPLSASPSPLPPVASPMSPRPYPGPRPPAYPRPHPNPLPQHTLDLTQTHYPQHPLNLTHAHIPQASHTLNFIPSQTPVVNCDLVGVHTPGRAPDAPNRVNIDITFGEYDFRLLVRV